MYKINVRSPARLNPDRHRIETNSVAFRKAEGKKKKSKEGEESDNSMGKDG